MTLSALRDDALRATADATEVRLSLPWIRSLPLASLREPVVRIGGRRYEPVVVLGDRRVAGPDLVDEDAWWHLQDRVVLEIPDALPSGAHEVSVSFQLEIPYLPAGPDAPLHLPFVFTRELETNATVSSVSRDVGRSSHGGTRGPRERDVVAEEGRTSRDGGERGASLPTGWTLSASAFNLTPEVVRAERTAPDLALTLVERGIAPAIEIELGQMWPGFPDPSAADAEALHDRLASAGGRVSIVGVSIDEFDRGHRRTETERRAFLEPQLRAAARAGAGGVRLPIGQAGALLDGLVPLLEELDLVVYEEAQGHQTPTAPESAAAYERIAELDTPRVRLLLDISMLMPALPITYLHELERGGIPSDLVRRLRDDWRDPATHGAVIDLLRSGGVPGPVHTLYMNLLVRFGRSQTAELASVAPLIGAAHLKFWDLDDSDGRISQPIRDVGVLLRDAGFTGTLCSEWGGQEWLDDDPWEMTSRHLALAVAAFSDHRRGGRPRLTATA